MWPGSWLGVCLLRSLGIMSRKVLEKSSTTEGCLRGWGTAHESQRNTECKVRKGQKGPRWSAQNDKASECGRAAESASLLCARQGESWHERDEVSVCVTERETEERLGEGVRMDEQEQLWGGLASWILVGSGKSKLALRRRAYGGQVGTLAATGACTCRQGETLPRGREGTENEGEWWGVFRGTVLGCWKWSLKILDVNEESKCIRQMHALLLRRQMQAHRCIQASTKSFLFYNHWNF